MAEAELQAAIAAGTAAAPAPSAGLSKRQRAAVVAFKEHPEYAAPVCFKKTTRSYKLVVGVSCVLMSARTVTACGRSWVAYCKKWAPGAIEWGQQVHFFLAPI